MSATQKTRASTSQSPRWRVLKPRWHSTARTWTATVRVYVEVSLMVLALTGALWLPRHLFEPVNIALLYLLPVLFSAVRWGLRPAIYAAVLGVLAFDYFFIPPVFSYSVSNLRYLISFAVFLAVAVITAGLASSLIQKNREVTRQARVTDSLYALSRKIAMVPEIRDVGQAVVDHVGETFGVPVAMVLPDAHGRLAITTKTRAPGWIRPLNPEVLQWVFRHGDAVSYGGKDRPELLYLPLKTEETVHGVLCLGEYGMDHPFSAEQRGILQSLSGLAAVSIARITYENQARMAERAAQSERVRTSILHSLSHELRTPVTAIMGAVSSLRDPLLNLTADQQQDLIATIEESVGRMNALIGNLLGMVRIESGLMQLNRRPSDVSDLIAVAVHQMRDALGPLTIHIPDNTPVVMVDEVLIEQALVNVLSNAKKYSPAHAPIEITVVVEPRWVGIEVRDFGCGIDDADQERIFEKFYRARQAQSVSGMGLGLAICQGIMHAHQGRIGIRPASPHGSIFSLELPYAPSACRGEME